jgi:hypothetical protein
MCFSRGRADLIGVEKSASALGLGMVLATTVVSTRVFSIIILYV